ncbi:MAG: ComF family protein [Bacteroidales bacterium]|nr:ComF family protein [Bacteroidales bacterium]
MKLKERLKKDFRLWARSLADLFLKRECVCCGRQLEAFESDVCTFCLAELPSSYTWISEESPADKTFWGRTRIEKVTSLFLYNGKYRNLVYSIKYGGNIRLGARLGRMLGEVIAEEDIDFIVPVPLHWRKKRKRGYNQSEEIGRGILLALREKNPGIKMEKRLLKRKDFTPTQTRKDRADRWTNVRDAFRVNLKRAKALTGNGKVPKILICDDVLTTGATLDACASLLHEALDCKISIATLAYVP